MQQFDLHDSLGYIPECDRFEADRNDAADRKLGPARPHRPLRFGDDPWPSALDADDELPSF